MDYVSEEVSGVQDQPMEEARGQEQESMKLIDEAEKVWDNRSLVGEESFEDNSGEVLGENVVKQRKYGVSEDQEELSSEPPVEEGDNAVFEEQEDVGPDENPFRNEEL